MSLLIRNAVRVLLLNNDKLLLMCIEDFDISTLEGKRNQRFWITIGGKIEDDESVQEAAIREIYEETGLEKDCIDLGPIVWVGEVDLILKGVKTRLRETFIVAKTKQDKVCLYNPTKDEKQVVKKFAWFSLDDIKKSNDVIFPICLPNYLSSVIAGNYPEKPIIISNQ